MSDPKLSAECGPVILEDKDVTVILHLPEHVTRRCSKCLKSIASNAVCYTAGREFICAWCWGDGRRPVEDVPVTFTFPGAR